MSRNMGPMVVVAIACAAVGVGAQTAKDQAPPKGAPAARIAVIGCIEAPAAGATGTAGTTGRTSDTGYTLTHTKAGKSTTKKSTDTSASTADSQTPASTYKLNAKESTLKPHVGHEVEVIATVEEPAGAAPSGTTGTAPSASETPTLKVQTVKMIAAKCPE
jgi:hypothetical protein